MISLISTVSLAWARFERIALVSTLLAMILLAVLQVILRNVFDSSLFWIDPLNRLLVLWIAILGAMVATREREHIAIDILKHYLSGRPLIVIAVLTEGFAALVCGLMAWHSSRFVYYEYLDGMQTFSQLPAWPFELIMPIGFSVMCLRFLYSSLSQVWEARL